MLTTADIDNKYGSIRITIYIGVKHFEFLRTKYLGVNLDILRWVRVTFYR